MDREAALAAFDAQVRRSTTPDGSGARVEQVGQVQRYVAADDGGWSAVVWSDLDESTADEAIAEQVSYFAELGRTFEWKHYAYDRPADLPQRLRAAGFEPEAEETLMAAEIADLRTDDALPPSVRLVQVDDEAGIETLVLVHEQVFGRDHAWLRRALLTQLSESPEGLAAIVAFADDQPVSGGRVEFHQGTDFASLWGGGTLPPWRGRGIFRALVAHRARLAAQRGFRYLLVDASAQSRPILERLGFVTLTTTTPYVRPQC